jgi:phage protein D
MPETALFPAAPTLKVGGTVATVPMRNVVALTIEEDVHGLCWMEARFVNWGFTGQGPDYLYLDRATFDFGTRIEVSIGPDGGTRVFAGKISAIEASYPSGSVATFGFCAEDGLQDLRLSRRTRTFDEVSTADVAEQLASDHGLTPDISLTGPTRTVVNQLNLSDLAFLRQLAHADGGEVWLDDGTLHVQGRADRDGGSVALEYGGSLLHFEVRADLAHQVTDVVATGWSVADKDTIEETADSGGLGAELGSDSSGSDVLAAAFSERHEHLVVTEPLTSDDARSRAKAAYLERARRFVTGSGTTGGTPELRVGSRVSLSGLGPSFNGDYRVVRTRHHFDLHEGYRTDFDVERAGIGATS